MDIVIKKIDILLWVILWVVICLVIVVFLVFNCKLKESLFFMYIFVKVDYNILWIEIFRCCICDSSVVCFIFNCVVVLWGLVIMLLVFCNIWIMCWCFFLLFFGVVGCSNCVIELWSVEFLFSVGSKWFCWIFRCKFRLLLWVNSIVCLIMFFSLCMLFG